MKLVLLPAAFVVLLGFPAGQYWHMPAAGDVPNGQTYDSNAQSGNNRAGAGGIYGTGSKTDYGIKCSHCHTQDDTPNSGTVDASITTDIAWEDVGGEDGYKPGQRYKVTIDLVNEHLGSPMGMGGNINGFALAIEDANGNVAGIYDTDSGLASDNCQATWPAPDPALFTTAVWGDCHAVVFIGGQAVTQWTFDWIAPPAGTGPVTIYYSVVDGDSGGDSSVGDDVKEGTIPLLEGN